MALPTNLAAKIKAIPMDPTVLATDLELAYLLSFSQHNISHDSIYSYPRESYQSPLEHYQFADFDESTYQKLLDETTKNYKLKNKQVVKGIRCGFKEFYARAASNTYNTAIKYMAREKNSAQKKFTLAKEQEEYRIGALKGNSPARWPEYIKEFVKELNNLPWFAFSSDSELFFNDFIESAKSAILNLCKRPKMNGDKLEEGYKENLILEIEALLGVVLRTNNQSYILEQLRFVSELGKVIELKEDVQFQICSRISAQFDKFFSIIPQESVAKYHYPESLWNKEPFLIMKKIHFQKYAGLAYYSIATDGKYLYFNISAINGGMFKVGTGQEGTKAGKVYLEKQNHFPIGTKVDEVNWVYLKGKLYQKTSSKDPWLLEVINPNNFTKEGQIQLSCPALFGQQSLININKNSPILTDGNNLFYLGSRIKITKAEQPQKKPVEPKISQSPEKEKEKSLDQKKQNAIEKKKKKLKKNENPSASEESKNQNYQKVLEIVLYEFSLDGKKVYNYDNVEEKDIDELYDSFSGYFTKDECRRAFVLNNYDLAQTCQWLFNEGEKEKEKNIKIYEQIDYVILAEAEITSNFQERNIKGPGEIVTKDGSILTIANINQSIWTMDKEHISCYSENGVKIFSKSKTDSKLSPDTKLSSCLLKTVESKFPKNPEYSVIFDPYHSLFYTFAWPQDGHYFPASILVSSDRKTSILKQEERKFRAEIKPLTKLNEISKFALHHMNLLDKSSIKTKYRFNDWLWYYGQKVLEVSNEMNLPQSEPDRNRLSNKRAKILTKMNKINDTEKIFEKNKSILEKKGKILKEIIKIYPFDAEGSAQNYKLITQAFINLSEHPQEVYLFVLCLENWLVNCPSLASEEAKAVLIQIGDTLFKLKDSSSGKNRKYITRLLLQQFYLFFPTLERQIKFITSLTDSELKEFLATQSVVEKRQKEEIVYELTKKEHLVQKFETNKCEFGEIFKSKSTVNVNDNSNVELIGNLLLTDILRIEKDSLIFKEKYDETIRKRLVQFIVKQCLESELGNKFVEFLFLNSFKMLKDNSKNSQLYLKYLSELFIEVFRLYERILSKSKPEQLFTTIPTILLIVEIYHASLVPLHPRQEIVNSLLKIIEYLQKPEFNEIVSSMEDFEYEGISPTSEKIYETSHPLERGKNYNFPSRVYPHATILMLELDKRCQSDSNNDTLNIQLLHEETPVGNNIQVNDGIFNSYLRLSGGIDTKKPFLLLGNSINVDFNSSGQVKDSQSLVRYGFKFGLRPIFAGKVSYSEQRKVKIEKVFKTIHNWVTFLNTLKFITVATSNTIENFLSLENEQTEPRINELLKGKVFKEGFEESSYKFESKNITPITTVQKFMNKTEYDSFDKTILKRNHESFWNADEVKAEVSAEAKPAEQLWNFENIPSYIKGYLEQIKQFKGDFIDVFTEARQLAKEKGPYAHILMKKIFQLNHKRFWLQGQAILFLTILKHSGLLHLNLKFSIEYIKQNLQAFEEARNGIYYSFISRIQIVNQWRDLIETYIGKDIAVEEQKKEEIEEKKVSNVKEISIKKRGKVGKTVKLGEEKEKIVKKVEQEKPAQKTMNRAAFEKQIRERLSNNDSITKGICNIRKIKYDESNSFETVTRIVDEVIKASEKPLQTVDRAYIDPIEHLIRSCLFLLKFKSPSTKQSLESNEQIVPISLGRSLSSDNRNVDANKLNLFRQWLENWKKWKGFKKEGKIELKFPVEQISKYINSWINFEEIESAINLRYHCCENRIQFYASNNQLLKLLSGNNFIKYAIGTETLNLPQSYNSELSSISSSKLKELDEAYLEFRSNIKTIENNIVEKLPLSFGKFELAMKDNHSTFLEKMKLICHNLFLLESENPEINLNIILYFITFKYLSNQNEDLIYLSNLLIQRAFIGEHKNEQLISLLSKEIGFNNISYKRWKDYFFIERVLFLLRKIEINCRRKVNYDDKIKIGEILFFILYHIEVPLISKLSLKIVKKLGINLKDGIKTPFDYEYKLYSISNKQELSFKQAFKLEKTSKNNLELLCSKINNIFKEQKKNELQSKFSDVKEKVEEEPRYNIILNLHQEEDLYWMIKALFYIDELQIKNKQKVIPQIKDYEEYLLLKGKKREDNKKEQQQNQPEAEKQNNKEHEKGERLFTILPKYSKIDSELEEELPVGWFFNYCNVFCDPLERNANPPVIKAVKSSNNISLQNAIKNPKKGNNNNNNNNNNKKSWNAPIYSKMAKRYEQLNSKPIEQPKQGDSDEIKSEFIKAKNYASRIRRYFVEVTSLIDNFSRTGYCLFKEDVSQTRMNQICQILTSGSLNRLKDISIELKNNDIKTRLLVNDFVPNFTTKMKITVIKTRYYSYFDSLVSYQNGLNIKPDMHSFYYTLLGKRQLSLEDSKAYMPYDDYIPFDDPTEEDDIEFGKQWIESNFSRMKKKYEKVYLNDYPNDTFYLGQGGIESGIKDNILVPANDSSLTLQTSSYEKVHTEPKNKFEKEYQETDLPEELMEKIEKILEKGTISITKKSEIKDYLLLTFYLKKLNNFDLQYIPKNLSKQFAQKLFKFSSNLNSYKELSLYQEDVQKLILKIIDNEHERLHLFGNYITDEDYHEDVQEYLVPLKLEKLNSSNEVKQETPQTHSYTKSKYLLKSQPPQIEQNKLLKYWEKSILPKIHEFVKTTLKPIEIEDFWEQMRRPLRVNDHTEAKRVAYIICDNKLPNGAVIPDTNHNWNSLEIEQIFVGENVLVKLPKSRSEFCTPLLGWGNQDSRLAKIIFIDTKNNSVLVRYRIEELALFSYTWVPVNSLMAVQKEVMHISTKSIYEELEKKLEGIIYVHAKQCLTKLASSVSEGDNIKLIKETILDLFINNPISGCFDFPKPVWSMRPIFEKMLEDKNFAILDILQKQFVSIKGIDLNLNSEKMTSLNRFDDAKALIVSFKKDARFSQCSGIKFYNDKYGYNEVSHVYTAKCEKTDIEPLEFNQPNIYCKFYTNKECLSIVEQNSYKIHPVEATIFAIDDMWTIGCYVGEVLCEIASAKANTSYLEVLTRINKIFINWILKKSVSVLCSYLAKLISKISLTIGYICEKNSIEITLDLLGITNDQLKDLISWISKLTNEEGKEVVALYTSLLQNLSQMAASILLKLQPSTGSPPDHVKSAIDLIKMFKQIDTFTKTKKLSVILPGSAPSYQWERILLISNIPGYFSKESILKKMKEIIQNSKGKILCPSLDIYLSKGNCYILVDGWDINELVEEEVIEKMEQEEEKPQEENETGMMTWICNACTYENPLAFNLCEICQTPAPVAAKPEEVFVVQATDLKAAEKKLKERQSKRFEEVKIQILKFFEDQHKVICDLVNKNNVEIEEAKNKNLKKNKKAKNEPVKEQPRGLPQKPAVKLATGSSIFDNEQIEEFLSVRFELLPAELKKMVEDQNLFVDKFRKLLTLGYDLWGDNIANENATLIPFNYLYMLMDYIQTEICKGSSSVLSYSEDSIRILSQIPLLDSKDNEEPINYLSENDMGVRVKYKSLAGFKSYNIRYSWKLVKELNLAASNCLQYINMDLKYDKDRNDTCPIYNDCLGYKLKYFRNLIMGVIKLELFQKIMQKTSVARENDEIPKIYLERLKTRDERVREGLVTIKEKEDHLFTKSHDQFLKISPAFLRPFKPKGADPYLSFTVTFKGELVMGEAGPYRQFFTDIGRELEPIYNLGLFIPSPNNRHQSGEHKSKWVINPKANSTYHFSLFEFIGTLMGCCFRTGGHLALDLPTMFWKSITHEEITDQDLQEIDSQLTNMIKMLKDCPSQQALTEATEATNDGPLNWTYRSCDDEVHEMIPNGKNIIVEFRDLNKYIDLLKLKKINEAKLQIKRILQGLSQLIPLPYLHCLTGEQLKLIICGRPKVDVELLKKHTKYSGGLNEESRRIKFFWEIMRELPEIDRLKIIRFCWGQERLPINSQEFQRNNIRFMIKPMLSNIKNQDQALPKADTCFFNIELPDYSTKSLMKEKILLAVNLDNVSINADENHNNEDNPLMNQIESYDQEEDYDDENAYGGGG